MARAKSTDVEQQVSRSNKAMKKVFGDAPWTDIFIPTDDSQDTEKGFNYVEAIVNGRTYLIQKGMTVSVPVPIYTVIKESGRFKVQ